MWLRWLPQFGNTNLETGKLNKNFLHSLMSYNFQQHLHTSEIIYVSTKKKLPLYVTRRQKKKKNTAYHYIFTQNCTSVLIL